MTKSSIPVVLTIAGSDSGGGAGIQADIKTISATGSYACSVVTAITSQNTLGVQAVFPVPVKHIGLQLDSVFSDLSIIAVKIGMLVDTSIISLVTSKIRFYKPKFVVLDPVVSATSGEPLLEMGALRYMVGNLLPLATIITPNISEALALLNNTFNTSNVNIEALSQRLRSLPTPAILLKGGHVDSQRFSTDILITRSEVQYFSEPRHEAKNTHGTGCSLSAAIASQLARGFSLMEAIREAKHYVNQAISHADHMNIGHGIGPIHHFYGADSV